ncbi:adenylate/guanylate cyclase domain-containing protein [Azospirillum sp.]|uniref:ATP-binding protein n=1 Tax=Azospirillum sp. TaxID=34012 RepID=UPI002620186D|nr:adenylate/guanylate cyclase domain-containing protein [Azospirillum sp.]
MAVVERIIEGMGGAAPHDVALPVRGKRPERKILTTLFVDIVSSSALVAGRDPEDADQILLSILNSLIEAVPRYDGMVSQLLGDGFMAVFGAPNAQEDHALCACLAAQDMVRATVEAADLPEFQVRIGISSGDVVAHVVANGVWADYRAVGECVHLAAKLQQRAEPNSAQLSRDTLDLIPVGVAARPVGSLVLAKGAVPMPAFTLEGARAVRRTAADMLRSTNAPFVGRKEEVATLFALADRAETGVPSSLILRGDAGIGKSRLVGEFLRDPRSRRWNVLQWSQMPIRRLGDPDDLEAVAQSLSVQIAGTANDNGPTQVIAAAERWVSPLAGDAIRHLFGDKPVTPLWSGLDPVERLRLSIDGLVGAVLELSSPRDVGRRPMLLLVEDAHWARPTMVRFLDALVEALPSSGSRLLLVVTMRPPPLRLESTEPEGWSAPRTIRRIDLNTLGDDQVRHFLNHWLGSDWSLADLKRQVAERSQGVPLYLEEMLRTLEANQTITGAPGAYRLADQSGTLNLPRSLHGLLAARMDLMGAEPRRLLLNAAVVGPTFDIGLLQSISATPRATLHDQLAYLERAGFIARARLLPNLEYSFNHALIRETAYTTLTKSDRKGLHGRILMALRDRRDHDLPNRVDLMALHAYMAEDWPLAYAFGRRAGRHAEELSKFESAQQHLKAATDALARLPETPRNANRMIRLSIALPRVLLPSGATDIQQAIDCAKSLSTRHGDRRGYAEASSMLASFAWADGRLDEAIALCDGGLTMLSPTGDQEIRVQLLVRLGGILTDRGHFEEACGILEQGHRLLGRNHASLRYGLAASASVTIHSLLARSLSEMAEKDQALAHAVEANELADQSGHIFSRIFSHVHLGWSLLIMNEEEKSLSAFFEAKNLCSVAKSPLWLPLVNAGIGRCLVAMGQVTDGLRLFEESYRCFTRRGGTQNAVHPRLSLAQVQIWHAEAMARVGDARRALTLAMDAQDCATASGQLALQASALFQTAAILRRMQNGADSYEPPLQQAITLATSLKMKTLLEACQSLQRVEPHRPFSIMNS